ncbi:MAG TPA: hypothetical protein VHE35_01850 [Kofleriaceae bacterium]|nr:hypothetical protein [Kofleriaceae bacterium]
MTQRQLLLRPDAATNNGFLYVLGEAAKRFGIIVLLPFVAGNHHHTIVYDPTGLIIEFVEHLHKFIAKVQNALRGRWENLWSSEPPCIVELADRGDVIDKIVYAATNPVKDNLVERVHHWPGVNGLFSLLNGRAISARRPQHFFRATGRMPESVTLELTIPSVLGNADEICAEIRERVAAFEAQAASERQRTGARVLGRRAILEQDWRGCPSSTAPHRKLRPRLAAHDKATRAAYLQRDRDFVAAYRAARQRMLAGIPAVFPAGTYWLRRFASVRVAESPAH